MYRKTKHEYSHLGQVVYLRNKAKQKGFNLQKVVTLDDAYYKNLEKLLKTHKLDYKNKDRALSLGLVTEGEKISSKLSNRYFFRLKKPKEPVKMSIESSLKISNYSLKKKSANKPKTPLKIITAQFIETPPLPLGFSTTRSTAPSQKYKSFTKNKSRVKTPSSEKKRIIKLKQFRAQSVDPRCMSKTCKSFYTQNYQSKKKDGQENKTYDKFINDFNNSQINIFGKLFEKYNETQVKVQYYATKYPLIKQFDKKQQNLKMKNPDDFPHAHEILQDIEFLKKLIRYIPNQGQIHFNYARIVCSLFPLIFGQTDPGAGLEEDCQHYTTETSRQHPQTAFFYMYQKQKLMIKDLKERQNIVVTKLNEKKVKLKNLGLEYIKMKVLYDKWQKKNNKLQVQNDLLMIQIEDQIKSLERQKIKHKQLLKMFDDQRSKQQTGQTENKEELKRQYEKIDGLIEERNILRKELSRIDLCKNEDKIKLQNLRAEIKLLQKEMNLRHTFEDNFLGGIKKFLLDNNLIEPSKIDKLTLQKMYQHGNEVLKKEREIAKKNQQIVLKMMLKKNRFNF